MKIFDLDHFSFADSNVYGGTRPASSLYLDYSDGIFTLKLGSEVLYSRAIVLPETIEISLKNVLSASTSCATRTSNGVTITTCQLRTHSGSQKF